MKLKELVAGAPCDGATTLAVIGALGDAAVLDAEVIGLCPTCGGSKKCPKCGGRGTLQVPRWSEAAEREFGPAIPCGECSGTGICSDCADIPVWVIAPEAMEAFVCALAGANEWLCSQAEIAMGEHREAAEKYAPELLQALLPGAREAEEIVTVHSPIARERPLVTSLHEGAVASGVEHYTTLRHGDIVHITRAKK